MCQALKIKLMSKTGDISAFTDLKPSGKEEMINKQL